MNIGAGRLSAMLSCVLHVWLEKVGEMLASEKRISNLGS